jgi:hypothetical protein
MFVETFVAPREEWESFTDRIRLFSEPPAALMAAIAWDGGEGRVVQVNLWDEPSAVADFFIERVMAVVERYGEPSNKPARHGPPVASYLRDLPPVGPSVDL